MGRWSGRCRLLRVPDRGQLGCALGLDRGDRLSIGIYYSLTGFACVWYYRHRLHGRDLWIKGLLPGLGAVLLLAACVLSIIDYAVPAEDETAVFGIGGTFVVGIGTCCSVP
ncbi:MAG: amino acid transporter [Pseudonocardia sp.]|jgi:hypothetical protein|nr:amino acid transporter [Pseudonocardia sp.]